MKFDYKILWEAVKEPLRILVLSIIPILLTYFGTINAEWAIILTLILRFIDKYLHELGKEIESNGTKRNPISSELTGGLTRF